MVTGSSFYAPRDSFYAPRDSFVYPGGEDDIGPAEGGGNHS